MKLLSSPRGCPNLMAYNLLYTDTISVLFFWRQLSNSMIDSKADTKKLAQW